MPVTCRLCRGSLFDLPSLVLPGMPSGAQAFLDSPESREPLVDLRVVQCARCGLVQLDNEPVPYWRSVITAAAWSPEMTAFRREQARDFVQRFSLTGRRVLEVGCGEGYFLDLLAVAGALPTGLEYGSPARARGLSAGRPVQAGYVTEIPPCQAPFDAFVCINFLEHSPEPGRFLEAIAAQLSPEAVGLVEVPSFDTTLERRRYYDFIRDHLSYFTADTLRFALESHGFQVLECAPAWHGEDIAAIVRRRPRSDFSDWLAQDVLVREFKTLTEESGYRRVAIWGASHQAMSLVALAKPGRVGFILDSAPAKQGRFEPALGLPILPPQELQARGADLVIVMAAGYSDEVISTLTQAMHFAGDIAVLRNGHLELVQSNAGAKVA